MSPKQESVRTNFLIILEDIFDFMIIYIRHGQSEARGPHAALQLIFEALGPFFGKIKSNIDLLLPEIWSKTVNKNKKSQFFLLRRSCNFVITYYFE